MVMFLYILISLHIALDQPQCPGPTVQKCTGQVVAPAGLVLFCRNNHISPTFVHVAKKLMTATLGYKHANKRRDGP